MSEDDLKLLLLLLLLLFPPQLTLHLRNSKSMGSDAFAAKKDPTLATNLHQSLVCKTGGQGYTQNKIHC